MIFLLPTFSRYLLSLSLVAILALIAFLLKNTIGLDQLNPFIALLIGLFLGHLISTMIPHHQSTQEEVHPPTLATLYVGNIAYKATKDDLEKFVSQYADVYSARIMNDKQTRKPRGYGFIEVNQNDAEKLIQELNGAEFQGRTLKVSKAKKK